MSLRIRKGTIATTRVNCTISKKRRRNKKEMSFKNLQRQCNNKFIWGLLGSLQVPIWRVPNLLNQELNDTYRVNAGGTTLSEPPPPGAKWHVQSRCRRDQNSNTLLGQISIHLTSSTKITYGQRVFPSPRPTAPKVAAGKNGESNDSHVHKTMQSPRCLQAIPKNQCRIVCLLAKNLRFHSERVASES